MLRAMRTVLQALAHHLVLAHLLWPTVSTLDPASIELRIYRARTARYATSAFLRLGSMLEADVETSIENAEWQEEE